MQHGKWGSRLERPVLNGEQGGWLEPCRIAALGTCADMRVAAVAARVWAWRARDGDMAWEGMVRAHPGGWEGVVVDEELGVVGEMNVWQGNTGGRGACTPAAVSSF